MFDKSICGTMLQASPLWIGLQCDLKRSERIDGVLAAWRHLLAFLWVADPLMPATAMRDVAATMLSYAESGAFLGSMRESSPPSLDVPPHLNFCRMDSSDDGKWERPHTLSVSAHLPRIPIPRNSLAAVGASESRRQVGDRSLGIETASERSRIEQTDMAAALAHHFDVVPVTKIADLDAVARIRKRDRIVFHTTDVP
jgi:hypothetical protein